MPPQGEAKSADNIYQLGQEQGERITTGSTMLDLALNGGFLSKRITNLVGDPSTGKTLIAIETIANIKRKYPKEKIECLFIDAENTYDLKFANMLGVTNNDVDVIVKDPTNITIEEVFEDILKFCGDTQAQKVPKIIVVDSLDALRSKVQMKRADDNKGILGTERAVAFAKAMRDVVGHISMSNVLLILISHAKVVIGNYFPIKTRSGGVSLDYYSSQTIYLSRRKTLKRTISGIDKVTGVSIFANVKKNKTGVPERTASFDILNTFGINDLGSIVDFLKSVKEYDEDLLLNQFKKDGGDAEMLRRIIKESHNIHKLSREEYNAGVKYLGRIARITWKTLEDQASVGFAKYT